MPYLIIYELCIYAHVCGALGCSVSSWTLWRIFVDYLSATNISYATASCYRTSTQQSSRRKRRAFQYLFNASANPNTMEIVYLAITTMVTVIYNKLTRRLQYYKL